MVMPGFASWNAVMAASMVDRAGSVEYSLQKVMVVASCARALRRNDGSPPVAAIAAPAAAPPRSPRRVTRVPATLPLFTCAGIRGFIVTDLPRCQPQTVKASE